MNSNILHESIIGPKPTKACGELKSHVHEGVVEADFDSQLSEAEGKEKQKLLGSFTDI